MTWDGIYDLARGVGLIVGSGFLGLLVWALVEWLEEWIRRRRARSSR